MELFPIGMLFTGLFIGAGLMLVANAKKAAKANKEKRVLEAEILALRRKLNEKNRKASNKGRNR